MLAPIHNKNCCWRFRKVKPTFKDRGEAELRTNCDTALAQHCKLVNREINRNNNRKTWKMEITFGKTVKK